MKAICESTQHPDVGVRRVSFECIAEIASAYYSVIAGYMNTLFQLTMKAVKLDQPEVGMQALEFWSSICDQEAGLLEEDADAAEEAKQAGIAPPAAQCAGYVQAALQHLVPMLLEGMCKQEEDQDDDTWNLAMASGTCLSLVAVVCRDNCVDAVMVRACGRAGARERA